MADASILVACKYGTGSETSLRAIETLLAFGSDPNTSDEDGKTPLIIVAENNKVPILELLLCWDADLDPFAFEFASENRHEEIYELLRKEKYLRKSGIRGEYRDLLKNEYGLPFLRSIRYQKDEDRCQIKIICHDGNGKLQTLRYLHQPDDTRWSIFDPWDWE